MSKAKHTPGPWDENNGRVFRGNSGSICILTDQHSFVEYRANARLIAAAPELLEALEYIYLLLQDDYDGDALKRLTAELSDTARAAIAKATGETEKLHQQ